MADTLNILGRAFSRRYVNTLLRLVNKYIDDPDNEICNKFKKLFEYVSSFERHCNTRHRLWSIQLILRSKKHYSRNFFQVICRIAHMSPLIAATETVTDNSLLLNTDFNSTQNGLTCSIHLPKLTIPKI